jgi:hypothetical protein
MPRAITLSARLRRIKDLSADLSRELGRMKQGHSGARAMADAITREADAAFSQRKRTRSISWWSRLCRREGIEKKLLVRREPAKTYSAR